MAEALGSPVSASFRDPDGYVFERNGKIYRCVQDSYAEELQHFESSGFRAFLEKKGWLLPHQDVTADFEVESGTLRVFQTERLPFISYPYEWCFSQLQDAALHTLALQKAALEHGMVLKDASAYNIQFWKGRPVLIDFLSFERFVEGQPWVAYRQFCQHFLAPLALMQYRDDRMGLLLRCHIDGIPLDLASRLLPRRTWMRWGFLLNLHLHARSQQKYSNHVPENQKQAQSTGQFTLHSQLAFQDHLKGLIRKLKPSTRITEWGAYYSETNYTDDAFEAKKKAVLEALKLVSPQRVWDLGGNNGTFSRLASEQGIDTVCLDGDFRAIEQNYRRSREKQEKHLLPLLCDLTNPSPSLGWHHQERDSLAARGPVELVMGLALIHHLAISNNVPLHRLADFFGDLGSHVLMEFVPKQDSQVQKLLSTREDIFPSYTQEGFEAAFSERFEIQETWNLSPSDRTLYLLKSRTEPT